MKQYGPDSLESWITSISCCFINMMMFGMFRLSGVLFVASISRFNASRNMASLPYTFASFVRNISGPLVGFLGHRYGVRAVTIIGCLLGTIGTGACYFAENIATVTVLWGATFGLGFGLGSILLPLSINQYFDKHRATASGISFSGACLGSFVLPPIVEIFIETYGLSGTYLLISGFILNCIPAALLLRKPTFDIKTRAIRNKICKQHGTEVIESVMNVYSEKNTRQKLEAFPNDNMEVSILHKMGNKEKEECILKLDRNMETLLNEVPVGNFSICKRILELSEEDEGQIRTSGENKTIGINRHNQGCLDLLHHISENDVTSDKCNVIDYNYPFSSVHYAKPAIWADKNPLPLSKNVITSNSFNEKEGHVNYGFNENIDELRLNHDLEIPLNLINTGNTSDRNSVSSRISLKYSENSLHQQNGDIIPFSSAKKKNTTRCPRNVSTKGSKFRKQSTLTTQVKNNSETGQQDSIGFLNIICNPMFNLIAITNGIYCFTFVSIVTVVVDFARDQEVGQSNEKYVIMSLSLGGLIGRLALGWITDRSYMTTTAFAAVCFAFQGISIAAIVWSKHFLSLIILLTLYGLSEAGIMVIYPIIISQYIDKDKQTVAIPSSNFLSGPLCLVVAPMIGYFRDEVGTYDFILYGLSILSATCSLVMLLAPKITRCKNVSQDTDTSL